MICKDGDYLAVWIYLLLNATHKAIPKLFKGEKITLSPGQLITGRKTISGSLHVSESKVQRILKTFENEQQIEQQISNRNRLISIVNWADYQRPEQQIEHPVNNERTSGEHPVNTNKNDNNDNNDKNERNIGRFTPPSVEEVSEYCTERGNGIDPQSFINFYESKGWMVGKNKMKSWKAAMRTWEGRRKAETPKPFEYDNSYEEGTSL